MPLYTFLMFQVSGVATGLDAMALPGDGEACDYADVLLIRHGSCVCVEVWSGERQVSTRHRHAAKASRTTELI